MPTSPDWRADFDAAEAMDGGASTQAKAARGRRLEKIFYGMLDEAGLNPRVSYRPKGEEIDGSFSMAGRTMLLEVKWTAVPQPADAAVASRISAVCANVRPKKVGPYHSTR